MELLRIRVRDLEERLKQTEAQLNEALAYEQELREQLTSTHEQLVYRDSEVMATLGVALAATRPARPPRSTTASCWIGFGLRLR